jgi:hypothetical protein
MGWDVEGYSFLACAGGMFMSFNDTDHIRGDGRLVEKHQPRRIKESLLPNPVPARSLYVGSMWLGCT